MNNPWLPRLYLLTLASYVLLLGLLLFWLWLDWGQWGWAGLHAFGLLLLLCPLPGVLKGQPYTVAWGGFIMLGLFCHGLVLGFDQTHPVRPALLQTALSLLGFLAGSFYARQRGRELGIGLKRQAPPKA